MELVADGWSLKAYLWHASNFSAATAGLNGSY